jgi:hypothetical protein
MPSRVIDTTGDRVRLYETHGELGQYACLSHCWGIEGTSEEQQQDRAQREAAISALDAAPVMECYIV